ncbi:serine hydrolase [Rhodohalobacter barkolensis]|uniref:beta-lactamase n=1 Tax=Rhodohalobacter barkolensis TaxID=2053187 RepID=A0A2N0VEX5_9BACT|nr:serine hydrolase [Rhodohalobacter barkolensis]PKD42735.1 serine hydrolase [Rhodohalobacter barkolensis]
MYKYFLIVLFFVSACSSPKSIDQLKADIENHISEEEGTFAIWFQHLQEPDRFFAINEDTLFHAASTMKTPVMIELFRRAEAGEFDLSDSIEIENKFYSIVDGSEFQLTLDPDGDDPFERRVGEMATLYDLNHAMITYSSNLTTNLLIRLVGAEETTETMRDLGAESIQVLRGVEDLKAFDQGLSNRTTAKDLGIIYEHIANGTAVSPEMDSVMVEVLKDQYYQDVLPEYLPDDVVAANKTGFITGVRHDSGIFYLPDGQSYILIFLSKNLPDEDRGRDVGREISKKIYDWLTIADD